MLIIGEVNHRRAHEKHMIYGVLRVEIRLNSTYSLKDKRSILRKQIERVRNAFHVSIHEVGDHDLLGNATVGVAVAGSDAVQVENVIQSILRMIEENPEMEVYDSVILVEHFK